MLKIFSLYYSDPAGQEGSSVIFKHSELRSFFKLLKNRGSTSLFRDWDKNKRTFLIRHDVDFDIELAHSMAKIEKEEGVSSTFFILTTGPTYNPGAQYNRLLLKEMHSWGFEIGLHFDPLIYGGEEFGPDLLKAVQFESDILSRIINAPVCSVSLHNPSIYNQFPMFEGFVNAYDPEIFTQESYISDSRMEFRNKDIFKFIDRIEQGTVQILLHPMHYSETGHGYLEAIRKHLSCYIHKIDKNFSVNTTYQKHVNGPLLKKIFED